MASNSPRGLGPLDSSPPEAWGPLLRFARAAGRPLERFLRIQAASGLLLLLASAAALAWANSSWADSYHRLWQTPLGIRVGELTFERSLAWVVNDGLMVIFFFVVGLEIRREIHCGELSQWRRAALPAAAAVGGMLIPALVYLLLAGGGPAASGWGVPMATDIAFAVGVLTLLGQRVPAALRVLLLALAVIDDLGAIVIIALFYSSGLHATGFLVATSGLAAIWLMQRLGVRAKLAYVAPSLVIWAGVYAAGVHPTIAGVAIGLSTPVRAWLGPDGFVAGVREEIRHFEHTVAGAASSDELVGHLHHVDIARREALSAAESLIHTLHPWVAYGIMPVFALANAGVALRGTTFDIAGSRVVAGVVTGLALGKPVGVVCASWLGVRLGLCRLPTGVRWRHIVVLGAVAGIGFTMALFVAELAFAVPGLLDAAKLGVLLASGLAIAASLLLGRILLAEAQVPNAAARTADEAEASTDR